MSSCGVTHGSLEGPLGLTAVSGVLRPGGGQSQGPNKLKGPAENPEASGWTGGGGSPCGHLGAQLAQSLAAPLHSGSKTGSISETTQD